MRDIAKPGVYVLVLVALLALTATTVGLSRVDLGRWHTATGLGIAAAKGLLVALFFMHALRAPRLIWAVGLASLFWLGILLSLTLTDYASRSWGP